MWLVTKEGRKSPNELTLSDFNENGGSGLLRKYSGSPLKVVQSLNDPNETAQSNSYPYLNRKPQKYWVYLL